MIDMIVKETLRKITDDLEYWANQPTGEFESGVVAGLVRAQSALIEIVESYKKSQSIEILGEVLKVNAEEVEHGVYLITVIKGEKVIYRTKHYEDIEGDLDVDWLHAYACAGYRKWKEEHNVESR